MQENTYKLTKYPVGSLREIWAISWPLIAAIMSQNVMLFTDRLVVARYSLEAMNAVASSMMWIMTLLVVPYAICEMTEVFVGRLNGAKNTTATGSTTWQMLWFSLLLLPFYLICSSTVTPILYTGSINQTLEIEYTSLLLCFSPVHIASVAIGGFFVGIGKPKYITQALIFSTLCNLFLDIALVFGRFGFPEMGLSGAALATGLSGCVQLLYLLLLFIRKEFRKTYGTGYWHIKRSGFFSNIRTALPTGIARAFELIAHCIFFRIVLSYGNDVLAQVTVVQSIFILCGFFFDGLSKAATAIISNLVGAKRDELIHSVVRAAIKTLILFVVCSAGTALLLKEQIISLFFPSEAVLVLGSDALSSSMTRMLVYMGIFMLGDGLTWILVGYFSAYTKTKFIMNASLILHWCVYIPAVYLAMKITQGAPEAAWLAIALYGISSFCFYWIAYMRSQKASMTQTTRLEQSF